MSVAAAAAPIDGAGTWGSVRARRVPTGRRSGSRWISAASSDHVFGRNQALPATGLESLGAQEGITMMNIVRNIRPPAGLTRSLFRLPISVYRLGLGWLFGQRLLLLNHIGRVTGKPRQTILEIVEHDATDGSYVVASGWGPGAAWYCNILQDPDVTIQIGNRTFPVTATPLSENEGAEIFSRYASRHRRLATYMLPRVLGMSVDGSDTDFREVSQRMPFVRLVVR